MSNSNYYDEECFDDFADELVEFDDKYDDVIDNQFERYRREYYGCDIDY